MKKILFMLLMSIIGIIGVKAVDMHEYFYYDTKVPNMYITKVKGTNAKNGAPFLLHKSNGTIVYCIEPFDYVTDSAYDGYYGYNSLFGLSKEQLNRMNLVARYGYGYDNHSDLKWYGITQYLIWQATGLDDIYFTDSYYGNRITAYTSEINEINKLVNTYNVLPSFQGKVYNFSIKTNYTIEDTNNVLKNFEVSTNSSNIEVSIVNNRLNIYALKDGTYTITFTKKDNHHNYELFYNANGQNLIFPGKIDDLKTTITVKAHKGKIEIKKHDIEYDDPYKNTSFSGAVYGLYKKNIDELVDTVRLDENGKGIFDNLQLTDYYVKEITPPIGYQLNSDTYDVPLSIQRKEQNIDVYDEVIKKDILITKYYGNPVMNHYYLEPDVWFDIYDEEDNIINHIKTDREGQIKLTLPYGKYKLKQVTTKEGYRIHSDIDISVLNTDNELYDLYDDEIIDYGHVELIKKGSDGNLLDGVSYDIYAAQDIISIEGDIYYHKDELVDKIITVNGKASIDLYYGKYYLKENETVNGYKLNNDKYYFDVYDTNVALKLINEKIISVPIKDDYVSVPNTGINDIDYMETLGILFIMSGYCIGLVAYKKKIGIY